MTALHPYQYVVLRCVPRPEREEFVNVGVVVYSEACGFLGSAWAVDEDRLCALAPEVNVASVAAALGFVQAVCEGVQRGGSASLQPLGQRFGFLKAPRSTVIQPGPVHGGLTSDPALVLDHLLLTLVN